MSEETEIQVPGQVKPDWEQIATELDKIIGPQIEAEEVES